MISERTFALSRLKMHALVCGDEAAPPAVLLHGFPELSESWRDVLPIVAKAGFYAVAPDLRGYGGTDVPRDGYDADSLALDIAALIDEGLGRKDAFVVGHDWGGAVAYQLAAKHPERVRALAVVNCPPQPAMFRRVWRPRQFRRSWYMLFFQLPWLPEWLFTREGGSLAPRMLRSITPDKTRFTRERLKPYADNFAQPERARAAIAYYRSVFRSLLTAEGRRAAREFPIIEAPFRLIWGEKDAALGKELTVDLDPYFRRPVEVKYLPEVGHFAPMEAPEQVGALIAEHFRAHG